MSHRWACLFGQPVAHSLSPSLHNAAFAALGIDAHYEAREVGPGDLPRAVEALQPHLEQARLRNAALREAAVAPDQPYRVIINATSLGHHGSAPELDRGCYSRDSVAIELVYTPPLTEFMVTARTAGARAEN